MTVLPWLYNPIQASLTSTAAIWQAILARPKAIAAAAQSSKVVPDENGVAGSGAFVTGNYRNLFVEADFSPT
jgi:hypothetical protein